MSNKTAFKVGDIVKLKCGGPDMAVQEVNTDRQSGEPKSYWCQWFAGKKLDRGVFPFESLVEVQTDDKP